MISRRHFLQTSACGFGSLALSALAHGAANPLAVRETHHAAKAKRVIFLFMAGGVSHVDSFDYKPRLLKDDGKMMDFNDARSVAKTGSGASQRVMKPLWDFKQHGQCGQWASSLFPNMAEMVDDLCFVQGMHTEGVAHGPATLFLHTGSTNFIRPSMGSWVSYGLGTENENLPAFVSISPSLSNGGPRNYGTAFLPPVFQGTALGRAGAPAAEANIKNIRNTMLTGEQQRKQFDLLRSLNHEQLQRSAVGGQDAELEAVLNSYELAWRLQGNAPETLDITGESEDTLKLYGINEKPTDNFGRQCLMARRLAEKGVRYIQVNYTDNSNNPAWDQHSNLPKHGEHAAAVDKPIAGLVKDLKQRGLLEDTLVWWGGEFGRTPYAERNGTGRDHNPLGFTQWLAGAGVKPGFSFGGTDEFGHFAVENKVHMHDMHATILHLLGLNHEKLTYRYAGRNFRLTDVHGHVVKEILA
ncbi:uncharacterized protein DUF1501 [Roseimicrobium gellanilyticum]|uniref:Uncharacterized protein DUF1501 n=1 Tax=Roseimicrobium gellanilyticum TaxID=748857 RepID=A0A366H0Z5_9BACT|nr:DUF1501 domain-containing protein [Roseimicrobium gellanilyticum]RBP35545.1 uncharacterized protein DUF1501 [Roseimicrobium gellanilyticum]